MLFNMTLIFIFKVQSFKMWISGKWRKLAENGQVWLLSRLIFAIEWDYCECCIPFPWPKFSRSYIRNDIISRKRWELSQKSSHDFCRGWYSPSNGTIVNTILRDLGLHFQGQFFLMYLLQKYVSRRRMSPVDLSRLARPPPWSCSCDSVVSPALIYPPRINPSCRAQD